MYVITTWSGYQLPSTSIVYRGLNQHTYQYNAGKHEQQADCTCLRTRISESLAFMRFRRLEPDPSYLLVEPGISSLEMCCNPTTELEFQDDVQEISNFQSK